MWHQNICSVKIFAAKEYLQPQNICSLRIFVHSRLVGIALSGPIFSDHGRQNTNLAIKYPPLYFCIRFFHICFHILTTLSQTLCRGNTMNYEIWSILPCWICMRVIVLNFLLVLVPIQICIWEKDYKYSYHKKKYILIGHPNTLHYEKHWKRKERTLTCKTSRRKALFH